MLGAHLFVCQMSHNQVWSLWLVVAAVTSFLNVMWHGVAFYGVGVQGVVILIFLGALFQLIVAPASQQGF
jgi:hypothetical protein